MLIYLDLDNYLFRMSAKDNHLTIFILLIIANRRVKF